MVISVFRVVIFSCRHCVVFLQALMSEVQSTKLSRLCVEAMSICCRNSVLSTQSRYTLYTVGLLTVRFVMIFLDIAALLTQMEV